MRKALAGRDEFVRKALLDAVLEGHLADVYAPRPQDLQALCDDVDTGESVYLRALVILHLSGTPVDLSPLRRAAQRGDLALQEFARRWLAHIARES